MTRHPRAAAGRGAATVLVLSVLAVGVAWQMAGESTQGVSPAAAAALPPELLRQVQAGPGVAVAGNPAGSVTVVEFFDYRCPYCRLMLPRLEALAASDKRVRLVFKDWPVFGGISVNAARIALAAGWQGKYLDAHKALFALPRFMDEASLRSAMSGARIDLARLDHDLNTRGAEIDVSLARTDSEARAIGFQGTPGLVIGTMVMPGALSEGDLRKLVNQAAAR